MMIKRGDLSLLMLWTRLKIFLTLRLDSSSDALLGKFIAGLPENSLRTFITISNCGISIQTCLALNTHGDSLSELQLSFGRDQIEGLAQLQNCTSIQKLKIETDPHVNLQTSEHDVFVEVITWLSNCSELLDIDFENFSSGPAILEAAFKNSCMSLRDLCVVRYNPKQSRNFHQALKKQRTLQTLFLSGDPDEVMVRDDNDALADALCSLTELRHLKLVGVSENLSLDNHVGILMSLERLEVFYSGGQSNDEILPIVAAHPSLRSVTFSAFSQFSLKGLLDFVTDLSPERRKFELTISNAEPHGYLGDEEVAQVRKALFEKVGGK